MLITVAVGGVREDLIDPHFPVLAHQCWSLWRWAGGGWGGTVNLLFSDIVQSMLVTVPLGEQWRGWTG